jgi:hypothetical protein
MGDRSLSYAPLGIAAVAVTRFLCRSQRPYDLVPFNFALAMGDSIRRPMSRILPDISFTCAWAAWSCRTRTPRWSPSTSRPVAGRPE